MTNLSATSEILRALASGIDSALNAGAKPKANGFVLLVMPFGGPDGARTNYISNAERKDVLVMLKEVVARFEGQPEQTGRA